VEQYRQDAVGQITRIGELTGELLGEAATGTIDDRTLAGLGMACELAAEKVLLYQQTAGMAAKIARREHGRTAMSRAMQIQAQEEAA
jgi:hypothetical protein